MRFFILTKRHITVALSLILGFSVITVSIFSYQALAASSKRLLPIYCVEDKGDKTVALSFDAAWGADKTKKILEEMSKNVVTCRGGFHIRPNG